MPGMIVLRVSGTPAPQGNLSATVITPKGGGKPRAIITEGRKGAPGRLALDKWREAVTAAGRDWMRDNDDPPLLDGPVRLWLTLWLPKPPSKPKWRWLPWEKPDGDKLLRATLDALTKVVIVDDARVVEYHVRKCFALDRGPGAVIRLEPLAEIEETLGREWAATGGPAPALP